MDYTYDGLYRMTHAEGWHGSESNFYDMQMGYYPNGRIQHKKLTRPDICCRNCICIYDNGYNYVSGNRLNRIEPLPIPTVQPGGGTVAPEPGTGSGDPTTVQINYDYSFQWDGAGNMMRQTDNIHNSVRQLNWDEENRLQGVKDKQYLSFYQYDANGERTYKLTGSVGRQNISGRWSAFYLLDNPTLYPSPYIVVTRKGYTKHYYAENERIASRIGGGGIKEIDTPIVEWEVVRKKALRLNCTHLKKVLECLRRPDVSIKNTLKDIYKYKNIVNQEKECYWYHPDHLGSSSWITFSDGKAVQHLHYLPWGENFVDQRSTGWNARFTFSAKERDTETGLSYFGSRYYSSDLSIWLSVDPQAAKYPSLSPYVYCANNPVKLVDPNGEEIGEYYNWYGKYLGSDGNIDDNVFITSEKIKKKNKDENGNIINVKADVSTTKSVLKESVDVYNRTVANGGDNEECSVFDDENNLVRGKMGQGGTTNLPRGLGKVSIHSHRLSTNKNSKGEMVYHAPEIPSTIKNTGHRECDETTFNGFDLNIIVGLSAPGENNVRTPQAAFYGRTISGNEEPIGTMTISDMIRIINHK